LKQEVYVPNDLELSGTGALLFGINSSGKTSLLRSLGICVILAQSGNFVPCDAFEYVPYRAMFSRILGNDDLFRGLSSFAVEMSELKVILRMADEYSLVLADEISKGSEMESAMSITTATIQHLAQMRSSFLITSHLHEIVGFDEIKGLVSRGSLRLCHLSVTYDAETDALVYDRILKEGSGESFYGLLVCRSLHLPQSFIDAAYAVRAKFMESSVANNNKAKGLGAPTSHYNAGKVRDLCEICKKEPAEETHHLAPQRAANAAGFIGAFHKNHAGNLAAVCAKCHDSIHAAATATATAPIETLEYPKKEKQTVRKKTTRGYKIFME
jgi:DNA mismatch repair protein MutS